MRGISAGDSTAPGPRGPRPRLDIALELFTEQGYEKTSLRCPTTAPAPTPVAGDALGPVPLEELAGHVRGAVADLLVGPVGTPRPQAADEHP